MNERVEALLESCLAVLRVGATEQPDETPGIDRAIDVLERCAFVATGVAAAEPSIAVQQLIEGGGALTATAEDAQFAADIGRASHDLVWGITYTNHTEPDMLRLLDDNYFFAPIIGMHRNSVASCDEVSVFLTIQAPQIFYPSHVHKAPELYHVIGGRAEWERGAEGFVERLPGEWICHSTGMRHAMRTNSEPLLSMAIWTADLDSIPVIVRA